MTTYSISYSHLATSITVEDDYVTAPANLKNKRWSVEVRPVLEAAGAHIAPVVEHPYEVQTRHQTFRFRWKGNKLMAIYEIEDGGQWRSLEYDEIPDHIKELL